MPPPSPPLHPHKPAVQQAAQTAVAARPARRSRQMMTACTSPVQAAVAEAAMRGSAASACCQPGSAGAGASCRLALAQVRCAWLGIHHAWAHSVAAPDALPVPSPTCTPHQCCQLHGQPLRALLPLAAAQLSAGLALDWSRHSAHSVPCATCPVQAHCSTPTSGASLSGYVRGSP
jgi:hypothetical protein